MTTKKTVKKKETKKKKAVDEKPKNLFFKEFETNMQKLTKKVNDAHVNVEIVPTGMYWADLALGGGIGKGTTTEVSGQEGTGKSSFALQVLGNWQKMYGQDVACIYIDTENAYSQNRAEQLGVDSEQIIVYHTQILEEIFSVIEGVVDLAIEKNWSKQGKFGLIVWDSIANTAALKFVESKDQESKSKEMGTRARLISSFLRTQVDRLREANISILAVNQVRDKIDTGFSGFGKKTTTPGGWAAKFAFYQTIELKKKKTEKDKARQFVILTTEKNKAGPPHIPSVGVYEYFNGYNEGLSFLIYAKGSDAKIMKYKQGNGYVFLPKWDDFLSKNCGSYESGIVFKTEYEFADYYKTNIEFRKYAMYIWKLEFNKTMKKIESNSSIMKDFVPIANTLSEKDIIQDNSTSINDIDGDDDDANKDVSTNEFDDDSDFDESDN